MKDHLDLTAANIIVRMPNWVGDLVLATPVLADLDRVFPDARITAMARQPICELLAVDPHIDELFCFTQMGLFHRRQEKRGLLEKLRQGKYDLGILLTNSFSSAWWFWQGRVARRLGFAGRGRSFLLTDPISWPAEVDRQHLVDTYKALLLPLGVSRSHTAPQLYLRPEEIAHARALLTSYGMYGCHPLIGINPGAAYGSAKCWLPDRFREVARVLQEKTNAAILFFGDQNGVSLVNQVCQSLPQRMLNLAGVTTLRELAALISLCDVLLTNDSGPMHMAVALGTEVVALFGPTSSTVTGPYGKGTVLQKHVACSPCYQRTCPIDSRCMKNISVREVVDAILKILLQKRC